MNKTAAPSNCAVVCVTREDTVLANVTTKKVNEQDTPKCCVGRNLQARSAKTTHTSVWIAQDTTESRVPRLNVYTQHFGNVLYLVTYQMWSCGWGETTEIFALAHIVGRRV